MQPIFPDWFNEWVETKGGDWVVKEGAPDEIEEKLEEFKKTVYDDRFIIEP